MGLDMFLNARRRIYPWRSHEESELVQQISAVFPELKGARDFDMGFGVGNQEISAAIGYWRKANHIHRWFVDHVQDGQDDCNAWPVSRERLTELKETCERVIGFRHLANELLPTASGFFFGRTDYDEPYYADIEHTLKVIDYALSLPDQWDLEYQASW